MLVLSATLTHAQPDMALPDYWPTQGWRTAAPADHGLDPAALAALPAYIESELPYLDSLLIIRHGYIVYESDHNDYDADMLHDIASVTKSWTSALVGIAQAQGLLIWTRRCRRCCLTISPMALMPTNATSRCAIC